MRFSDAVKARPRELSVVTRIIHSDSYQEGTIEIVYGTMLQHVYKSPPTQQRISGHFPWKWQQPPCDDANIFYPLMKAVDRDQCPFSIFLDINVTVRLKTTLLITKLA